jgi:hypothetical protein
MWPRVAILTTGMLLLFPACESAFGSSHCPPGHERRGLCTNEPPPEPEPPPPDTVPPPDPEPPDTTQPPSDPGWNDIIVGIRPRGYGAVAYSLLAPVGGTTYYVAPSGNDADPGTSAQPFRTIQRAANAAVAGDVVTIRDGTYNESVLVANSGTATQPIVFQAENRGGVILTGGGRTFRGANFVGQIGATPQRYVTLRGLTFRQYAGNASGSAAVRASHGWTIEDCWFDDAGETGLSISDHDVTVVRSTLENHWILAIGVYGGHSGGMHPDDPQYRPIEGLRLIDLIVRNNNLTDNPITGGAGTSVLKVTVSRGLLVDNIESYGNKELNWGGGLIERNAITTSSGPGIGVVNTHDLRIEGNLFVENRNSIELFNLVRDDDFHLAGLNVIGNAFKDWRGKGSLWAVGGSFTTPQQMGIMVDYSVYDWSHDNNLAEWPPPLYGAWTIEQMRDKYDWEYNGTVGPITF